MIRARPESKDSMYDIDPMLQESSGLYALASSISPPMSPPKRTSKRATTRNMMVHAWTLSVARDAGRPPLDTYPAVTIPTSAMGISGSIPERVSIPLPIAVNSANRKVNMYSTEISPT